MNNPDSTRDGPAPAVSTPVWDFISRYITSGAARLHMPGHKGTAVLGCEPWDITEIAGAGELYSHPGETGPLEESQANAAALFGSGRTLYSVEGSSLCVRAMVYLAMTLRPRGAAPVIVAARNVHSSFVSACALCGAEPLWLAGEDRDALCAAPIAPEVLAAALDTLPRPPAAVYVTSPDYLGGRQDLAGLAQVCRARNLPLLVDNAHGAYLKFLPVSAHPLDLGAAACCDSAHKTLPVLTGGAYLHIAADAPAGWKEGAAEALALFASTSPSWLLLASLDRCNAGLAEAAYTRRLWETLERMDRLRHTLRGRGWALRDSDPLRLTLAGDGNAIAERLRRSGVEPELADRDFCVLMATPENPAADLDHVAAALGVNDLPTKPHRSFPVGDWERACSLREAMFSPRELVPLSQALGRVCAWPATACPPAVPPVMPGERVGAEALAVLEYCGVRELSVAVS